MYNQNQPEKTSINVNNEYEGETIEQKVERILNNGEPISEKDSAPRIYTERKDGVIDAYNIRADKWDQAIKAASQRTKYYLNQRQEGIAKKIEAN